MMGKLLKYDFKSMLRSFVPLWLAFLAVSIINRFTIRIEVEGALSEIVGGITMFLYVILMLGINIIGIILVIQRFYNGLLKDEGYLMFTLPVKPWHLVVSKGISATVLIIINAGISLLSVFILAAGQDFFEGLASVIEQLSRLGLNSGLFIFLLIVLLIAGIIKSAFQIYASMALGHLANKHRVGYSVGAYIAISVVLSILGSILMAVLDAVGDFEWLENLVRGMPDLSAVNLSMVFLIVITLVQLAAFYVITERILTRKLNLE